MQSSDCIAESTVQAIHNFTHIEQLHLEYEMYFYNCFAVPQLPCSTFTKLVHLTIDSADWDEPPNSYAYLSQVHSLRYLKLCSGVPPAPGAPMPCWLYPAHRAGVIPLQLSQYSGCATSA